MTERAEAFLERCGMLDPAFDVLTCADRMQLEMKKGLRGENSSYPMIPTYLAAAGNIPDGVPVAVIDAGGTNFRSGLVHFENGHCVEEHVQKCGMPGIGKPATWEEFIRFTADSVEELMSVTDRIGFCFSYSADVTPDIDGRVIRIDKEVEISGCEGRLVGASLTEELARRGLPGKRVVVLNDTAAVQLGGMAKHLHDGYVGCFGQVSGTGTNTCCTVPGEFITKLGPDAYTMLINMESGMYDGLRQGDLDRELDLESHNPGEKHFEKMTAGVYLGELCRRLLRRAGEENLLSVPCFEKILQLPHMDSRLPDTWAVGEGMEELSASPEDAGLIQDLAAFLFRRSASFMCANLTAMALLTGAGLNGRTAVFAEGSLVQKNHIYRPALTALLEKHLRQGLGRDVSLVVEEDTTLPGAAAAALLNLK